jgi:hypothetical protein
MNGNYINFLDDEKEINIKYGLRGIVSNRNCTIGGTAIECNESTLTGGYPWNNFPNPLNRDCNQGEGCFGRNSLIQLTQMGAMYNQLSFYINNTIKDCLDFSIVDGLEVKENGTSYVNVTTNNKTVVVVFDYPLTIKDLASEKLTKLAKFYYDTNIRLKAMHYLAYDIVEKDIKNESFDVRDVSSQWKDELISIEILKFPSYEMNPYKDNIVRMTDNFSRIPFIFQFGRQNRPPVLDFIPNQSIVADYIFNESYFDFVHVYDPDEDETFRYYRSRDLYIPSAGIHPVTSFTSNIRSYICGLGIVGSFDMEVCVTDNNNSDGRCKITDQSKDWQEVHFDVTC